MTYIRGRAFSGICQRAASKSKTLSEFCAYVRQKTPTSSLLRPLPEAELVPIIFQSLLRELGDTETVAELLAAKHLPLRRFFDGTALFQQCALSLRSNLPKLRWLVQRSGAPVDVFAENGRVLHLSMEHLANKLFRYLLLDAVADMTLNPSWSGKKPTELDLSWKNNFIFRKFTTPEHMPQVIDLLENCWHLDRLLSQPKPALKWIQRLPEKHKSWRLRNLLMKRVIGAASEAQLEAFYSSDVCHQLCKTGCLTNQLQLLSGLQLATKTNRRI